MPVMPVFFLYGQHLSKHHERCGFAANLYISMSQTLVLIAVRKMYDLNHCMNQVTVTCIGLCMSSLCNEFH